MYGRCRMARIWKRAGPLLFHVHLDSGLRPLRVRRAMAASEADGAAAEPRSRSPAVRRRRRWADLPPPFRGLGRVPYISSVGNETCLSLSPPSLHVSFPPFMQQQQQRVCREQCSVVYRWPDRHFSNGKTAAKGNDRTTTNPCRRQRRARLSRRRASRLNRTDHSHPRAESNSLFHKPSQPQCRRQ